MVTFLEKIAKIYFDHIIVEKEDGLNFNNILFVFPNKRAGEFFIEAMIRITDRTIFAPRTIDINGFAEEFSKLKKADNIELLFVLYNCYKSVAADMMPNDILPFDDFISLGNSILADFNEVDKYLVDTKLLFHNISALKDLTDYTLALTEEQRKTIRLFWGNVLSETDDDEGLNFNHRFITIWNMLLPIYNLFNSTLRHHNIGYEGMIYRDAIERIAAGEQALLPLGRVVFVGFNRLTHSERKIMQLFNNNRRGDYYFDYPAQYEQPPFNHSVTIDSRENQLQFAPLYRYSQEEEPLFPDIDVYSSASFSGQTKIASQIIHNISRSLPPETDAAVRNEQLNRSTAIVLADETLLSSLTSDLPDYIHDINITMGYPFKLTSLASLISNITALQQDIKQNRGLANFYYKPLLNILSNPLIQNNFTSEANAVIQYINHNNLIRVPQSKISHLISENSLIFHLLAPQATTDDEITYLINLMCELCDITDNNAGETDHIDYKIDLEYIIKYIRLLRQLQLYIRKHGIDIQKKNFASINESIINGLSIQFDGTPLRGLQIMGKLEARLLDFDNIIIIGANDDKLPGSNKNTSLIPYNLRRAYNMPTYEHEDAIYSYNFYRMLYRAKNLHLIYDSRTDKRSELSRYFLQIKYLIPTILPAVTFRLRQHYLQQPLPSATSQSRQPLVIEKDSTIMRRLENYRSGNACFSASRIKDLIACPIRFYFRTIANLHEVESVDESVQSNMLGTIFHAVMQHLYDNMPHGTIGVPSPTDAELNSIITKTFHDCDYDNISGFNILVFNIIKEFVNITLRFDKSRFQHRKFHYEASELKINTSLEGINFVSYIDRIDNDISDNGKTCITHIIDYKTTKIDKNAPGTRLLDLFESADHKNQEQFQLLLYCYIYSTTNNGATIQPNIYNIYRLAKMIKDDSAEPIKFQIKVPNVLLENPDLPSDYEFSDEDRKKETTITVSEYSDISAPFEWMFRRLMRQLYDSNIPFTINPHNKNLDSCKFCPFKNICNLNSTTDE